MGKEEGANFFIVNLVKRVIFVRIVRIKRNREKERYATIVMIGFRILMLRLRCIRLI